MKSGGLIFSMMWDKQVYVAHLKDREISIFLNGYEIFNRKNLPVKFNRSDALRLMRGVHAGYTAGVTAGLAKAKQIIDEEIGGEE